ncbi:MAG TPA: hypothetical protein VN426_02690 [Syntrophomonadaceae bacterium]|nr:hypothetical protein [Syntrophomonadaceae bacterium]
MEYAYWLKWQDTAGVIPSGARIYLGEECCERKIPALDLLMSWAWNLKDSGCNMTLVTPLVSESVLGQLEQMLDRLSRVFESYEVVCNDWGVFSLACERPFCQQVVGRLLARQDTDPRLAQILNYDFQKSQERDVRHVDGTIARLTYLPPPPEYETHLRRPSIITSTVLDYLGRTGAGRLELNNTLQGLDITLTSGWKASIYVPDVLVTMKRHCSICNLADDEGKDGAIDCSPAYTEWTHPSFPLPLYAKGNALYYFNQILPDNCENLDIDRIVSRLPEPASCT